MKHRISGKKLGRDTKRREALFRSLATSFIHHGFIKTSLAKAQAIQPIVEKLVTKARKGTRASYSLVHSFLQNQTATQKLIAAAPSLASHSGFTRMKRIGVQKGDASSIVRLEWVSHKQKSTKDQQKKAS